MYTKTQKDEQPKAVKPTPKPKKQQGLTAQSRVRAGSLPIQTV